jgi:hypothetical protein
MTIIIPTLKEISNWNYLLKGLRENLLHLMNYALHGLIQS